ncbi:hypothetical protein MMC10_008171 [Thelotrema lepadinum]|nr:hypothetical protein [Thelotrema lepadinum]
MAAIVPNSLKSADITRFVSRAAQIEKAKPAVAYWCTYWIVQQIVTKGLHNTDDESKTYTSELMDKLEAIKASDDDAINDELAGQALIEQFGLEVFARADNAVRANKASRQTADTFQAAYTFLELLQIWPPVDPEITAKIKFAKYHALRIAKAIKAGEDPNLSNPEPESASTQEAPPLDSNDPEVRALQGTPGAGQPPSAFCQPSVEEVPDEHDRLEPSLARTSTLDQSLHPSRDSSIPRPPPGQGSSHAFQHPPAPPPVDVEDYYQTKEAPDPRAPNGDVSPLGPPSTAAPPSIGGGYFPRIPDDPHAQASSDAPLLPDAPGNIPQSPPTSLPPISPPANQTAFQPPTQPTPYNLPQYSQQPQQPPYAPHPSYPRSQPAPAAGQGYGTYGSAAQPSVPSPHPQVPHSQYYSQIPQRQPPLRQHVPAPEPEPPATVDEEAMNKAQKHARWAISALNFEDVPTAVKELRGALEALGSR